MPKKAVFLFTLLTLTACFLSYEIGSSPVALAKNRPAQEEIALAPPPLPAPPAEWVITNAAGGPTAASATRAGIAGTQHVADCVSFSIETSGTSVAPNVVLLDGSTVLMQWYPGAPPYSQGAFSVNVCGLSVVGGVGNSMTLKFGESVTGVGETVNLVGHDAT